MLALILLPCAVFAKPAPSAKATIGDQQVEIDVGGQHRYYFRHVSPSYNGRSAVPLLIMLHGAGGIGKGAMIQTRWDSKADQFDFIAVLPDGTPAMRTRAASFRTNPRLWNDGSGRAPAVLDVNDYGFIQAVIDQQEALFKIDRRRIYATGFSNGASMTFALGVRPRAN